MTELPSILCYGDSNTWGFNPSTRDRFPQSVRWTGMLQSALKDRARILEEELNGRTTVIQDPEEDFRCGLDYLMPCLRSHRPLHHVLLLLGTNDLKDRFDRTPQQIAAGIDTLVTLILESQCFAPDLTPSLTLMAPPPLTAPPHTNVQFVGGYEKSLNLANEYAVVAQRHNCSFLDLGQWIQTSLIDGIHWETDAHTQLAEKLTPRLVSQIDAIS